MIGLVAAYAVHNGRRRAGPPVPFDAREGAAALWHGKWELLLPVVVLGAFFSGYATILETSALTALYALVVQVFIHRNISIGRPLRRVFAASAATIGGVLLILVVAYGLTAYLIDADVPGTIASWTRQHVHSRLVFLLILNVFLLAVGCVMDMYSAILVVAPIVLPTRCPVWHPSGPPRDHLCRKPGTGLHHAARGIESVSRGAAVRAAAA